MSSSGKTLVAADYAVFGVTLGISAFIGIFFAVKERRKTDTDDYLLGGRKMGMVPVGFSLAVSYLSAIALLGVPAEFYFYGAMFWWFVISLFIGTVITAEVFIPIYYRLKISSMFEYLERRFHRIVRLVATFAYIIQIIMYAGIVVYAPALALNAVTGFDLWAAILSTGLVCIFYTALGGLKAVVWTDVFQATIMIVGFVAILIKGSIETGGFGNVWDINAETGRTIFTFHDFDPRYRHTVWSLLFGGTFLAMGMYSVSQSQVQRYISCKTLTQAKGSLYINWVGLLILNSLCLMNGAILYAYYKGRDPIKCGNIQKPDQLIPLLTLDLFHEYPGLPGLIVSCLFSGSLSTVSSGINAMACVTIEDFIKPVTNWSDRTYTWISKGLVIVFGGLCIAMAYLASVLGSLLQAAFSILSIISGPLVGLFLLGISFPFANTWGAIFGLLSGIGITTWLYLGKLAYPTAPEFLRRFPRDEDFCPATPFPTTTIATTTSLTTTVATGPPPALADFYAVSYIYYSVLGAGTVIIIGLILSLITCGWRKRKDVDPDLLHFPFDHWSLSWLPEKFRRFMRCGVEIDDDDVMQNVEKYEVFAITKQGANGNSTEKPFGKNGQTNNAYTPSPSMEV